MAYDTFTAGDLAASSATARHMASIAPVTTSAGQRGAADHKSGVGFSIHYLQLRSK